MKKTLLLVTILMASVVFFAACNTNPMPPTDTTAPDVPIETTAAVDTELDSVTSQDETTAPDSETDTGEHAHTWSNWVTLTKPKCEEGGQEQRYCTICYLNQTKPIEPTGHTEEIDTAVPPTCTQTGLTEGKHCSVCSAVLVAQTIDKALGHTPGSAATCTTAQTCTVCGFRLASATGHHAGDWILDSASTCVELGSRHKECTVCGARTQQDSLAALGHDYVVSVTPPTETEDGCADYVCSRCTDSYTEVLTPQSLSLNDSNFFWIGFTGSADEELVIPTVFQYNGNWYRVTSIGDKAFYGCTGLTSITIPDSVTSIGDKAFYGCTGLTSITLPDSVTRINDYVFYGCTGLTSITIPDSVTSIGDNAFYGCTGLTSITIPDSVTSIGNYAFYDCRSLTAITIPDCETCIGSYTYYYCMSLTSIAIPDSVWYIAEYAFFGCHSLTSVVIPDSVTSIDAAAFSNCYNLTSITVAEGNPVYHSDGNCLIETSSKTLVAGCKSSIIPDDGSVTSIDHSAFRCCAGLTSIVIPDSVESIGSNAFDTCINLTSIEIPDSVTSIGSYAFFHCTGLTSIVIPANVKLIGKYAFYNCYNLTSVTFEHSSGWYRTWNESHTSNTSMYLTDDEANARYLWYTYSDYYFFRR